MPIPREYAAVEFAGTLPPSRNMLTAAKAPQTATEVANEVLAMTESALDKAQRVAYRMGMDLPPSVEKMGDRPQMFLVGALDSMRERLQEIHATLDFLSDRL